MIEQQARRDLGTPAIASDTTVALEIDGIAVTVPAGTSIMRAAALAGNAIPRLCATDALDPFGSCRLCLVEIDGRRGYPASCTTPAEDGMRVRTQEALSKEAAVCEAAAVVAAAHTGGTAGAPRRRDTAAT